MASTLMGLVHTRDACLVAFIVDLNGSQESFLARLLMTLGRNWDVYDLTTKIPLEKGVLVDLVFNIRLCHGGLPPVCDLSDEPRSLPSRLVHLSRGNIAVLGNIPI
jgi:hypothetical protein